MRMSGVSFRKPPVPHFLRNRVEMAWQKSRLDCTGASGWHAYWHVFGKRRPRGSFLFDFDVVSGARRSHVVDFGPKKRSCLAGCFSLVVRVMEPAGPQPGTKSR